MAGFSTYTGFAEYKFSYTPGLAAPTSAIAFGIPGVSTTLDFKTSYTVGTNIAAGINEVSSNVLSIPANTSTTLNLQSIGDVMGRTISYVRLKNYMFRLLTAAQDSTNGTACSSITIGNSASFPNGLAFGGVTNTQTINNGGGIMYDDPGATGIAVSVTANNVKIVNNDLSNAAGVLYGFQGADA